MKRGSYVLKPGSCVDEILAGHGIGDNDPPMGRHLL